MKPTPQIQQRFPRHQKSFPATDYSYQGTAEAVQNSSTLAQKEICSPNRPASWKISRDYFGVEATRDFVTEVIFFAWIAVVAAWSISMMLHQLLHWII